MASIAYKVSRNLPAPPKVCQEFVSCMFLANELRFSFQFTISGFAHCSPDELPAFVTLISHAQYEGFRMTFKPHLNAVLVK